MKPSVFLLFLFISTSAFSSGYGGAEGKNRMGQIIYFSDSIASASRYEINVSTPNQGENGYKKFSMESECPELTEWIDITRPEINKKPIIHCRADGKSPLAGATYTKIRTKKIMKCGAPATAFKCIKGCENKSVPLLIVESPWEC